MWPRWRSECGEPLGLDNWILCLGERGCSVPYVTMEYWGKRDRKHLGNLSLKSAPCPPSPSAGTARVRAVLQGLGLSPGAADTELVQRVCAAVCTRAARLCAAALAAVLTRLQHGREQQTLQIAVATGGRVFERHPRYGEHTGACVSREQGHMCETPTQRPLWYWGRRAVGADDAQAEWGQMGVGARRG